MDKITLQFSPYSDQYEQPYQDRFAPAVINNPCPGITVLINERTMPDVLDVDGFFQALQASGRAALFNCMCGVFGCGGYFVDVTCTPDVWTWSNRYHPLKETLLEEFTYHFDWPQVRAIALSIITYLEELHSLYPDKTILQGLVGPNLIEKLPEYRLSPLLH